MFETLAELQNREILKASKLGHWPKLTNIPIKATILQQVQVQEAKICATSENDRTKRVLNRSLRITRLMKQQKKPYEEKQ